CPTRWSLMMRLRLKSPPEGRYVQHVVVFVFDLPPPPAHVCNVPNVVRRQAMIGNTAIVIELLARLGVADSDLKPIDGQGLVPTAEELVVEVAHHGPFREASIPAAACMRGHPAGGLPKRHTFSERGMGVGLTRKDEVETLLQHQRTKGLGAGEAIAQ